MEVLKKNGDKYHVLRGISVSPRLSSFRSRYWAESPENESAPQEYVTCGKYANSQKLTEITIW